MAGCQQANFWRLLLKQSPSITVLSVSAAVINLDQATREATLSWAAHELERHWEVSVALLFVAAVLLVAATSRLFFGHKRCVYLLDFAVHKPDSR